MEELGLLRLESWGVALLVNLFEDDVLLGDDGAEESVSEIARIGPDDHC